MSRYQHTEEVHNLRSPQVIVPDLISYLRPRSVVDIGCGLGTFLSVFNSCGVEDIRGVDGGWVDRDQLHIDEKFFEAADLERPLELGRRFDLAICLEVVEHLEPSCADTIIESLCSASNTVVFSAAIPNQGGQNHLNEQPLDYWQEKFAARGFVFFDIFRERYWNDDRIDWWYRQNMMLAAHESAELDEDIVKTKVSGKVRTLVHPELLRGYAERAERLEALQSSLSSPAGILKLAGRKLARRR